MEIQQLGQGVRFRIHASAEHCGMKSSRQRAPWGALMQKAPQERQSCLLHVQERATSSDTSGTFQKDDAYRTLKETLNRVTLMVEPFKRD